MKTHPSSISRPPRGFALVVTMSLMVLLLILAVGLLSLSAVSLRTSTIENADRIAKGNARLGLLMAIGELQKHAGKDQRITGTADLAGTATGERLSDGTAASIGNNTSINGVNKGLSNVQAGTRYWTGVWKNSLEGTGKDPLLDPTDGIFVKTPSPELVQWLISGNENKVPGDSGYFLPSNSSFAVGQDGEASNPDNAVVLVGKNTVGDPSTATLSNYVVAPLVTIESDKSAGKYAWWIGDEGVKARLNMANHSNYSAAAVATYESMSAPRRGWETVAEFGNYPAPDDQNNAELSRVVTLREAELLDATITAGAPSPLEKAFHSATTDSFGVLSDSLRGGLKYDLTPVLSSLPTTSENTIPNSPKAGENIIPTAFSPTMGPRWDRIQKFAKRSTSNSGVLQVEAPATIYDQAIAPVIVDFRLLLGAEISPPESGGANRIHPCVKVALSLGNPYPRPLNLPELYVEIRNSQDPTGSGFLASPTRIYANGSTYGRFTKDNNNESSVLGSTYFKIPSGTLEPGEARAYGNIGAADKPVGNAPITVEMAEFNSFDAASWANSVKLMGTVDAPTVKFPMDVRENDNTSQVDILLSLTQNGTPLRALQRFELDNAEFMTNRHENLSPPFAKERKYGLMLYSMQLSQPGVAYGDILGSSNMGIRSSTVRTFADFNLQAINFPKSIISYHPAPYFVRMIAGTQLSPPAGSEYDKGEFTSNLTNSQLTWGRSPQEGIRTVLFGLPKTFASLAQLQHADLTSDDRYASVGHQPGNAVGNSYATPYVMRNLTMQQRTDYVVKGNTNSTNFETKYYDISYRLNAALWDGYFFSTIDSAKKPMSASLAKLDKEDTSALLLDPKSASSRIWTVGAFNVNSTDKTAWKTLLASSKHLKHPSDQGQHENAMFPRSLEQTSSSMSDNQPPSGSAEDSFTGFRRLSDTEIDLLAEEITKQVRIRGPFVSLSHFVNRALASLSLSTKHLSRSGALQSAIDESGMNISSDRSKLAFDSLDPEEDKVQLKKDGSVGKADLTGTRSTALTGSIWPSTSKDGNPGSMASIVADNPILTDSQYQNEQGQRSTGIPGWLTQADVLQVIGPSISVRSDTFRIRSYGQAEDPSGKVLARAWCEAIVQRFPNYVDQTNTDDQRKSELSSINVQFGRQMKIISFRWLSPYEI